MKFRSCDLERVVRGDMLVGRVRDVAGEMVSVFQKDTMKKFLSLVQEALAERWEQEQNVNENIVMEFVKLINVF